MTTTNNIALFITDVDGTLTDGGMYYSSQGEVMKKFNTKDAVGLRLLQEQGIIIAIITGEDSDIVRARALKLKIQHVYCGIYDKLAILNSLCEQLNIDSQNVAYVGDDLNDTEIMKAVGLSFAVGDAEKTIKEIAHINLERLGGYGAVREAANYILEHHNET
ncbi:MAG TPA: HAD family hydrolase [Dehalococcoidia bacterium]|jgi:YrbI family 3-deoxy-D-manno-octulosonate 8-phosphate phosphatase|nr:HAD family hydrolase [Dehalococcoidia bacterium]